MTTTKIPVTAETFQAQYPLALAALADHMLTHDLPAPWSIDRVLSNEIQVLLIRGTAEAWLATVAVDEESSEVRGLGIRSDWTVRLPDTGFRLHFIGYRDAPRPVLV